MADAEKIEISNLEELKAFRDAVNAGESYKGKTVVLTADIDLQGEEWTPIGNSTNQFQGNFDGQGHTVSNLKIDGAGKSNQGFFGFTTNGSVSNLTIKNATVTGRLNVGVVAGTPYTSKYTNIKVTGHVEVEGMAYVGGVGGKNAYADWTDITVDVDETSFVKADSVEWSDEYNKYVAYRTYVGGVIGFMGEGGHTLKNITSNINVEGSTCDVGGIVGIAHYQNNFENVSCTAKSIELTGGTETSDGQEVGAIAGVWHNQAGTAVNMINVSVSGDTKVKATYVDDETQETATVEKTGSAGLNGKAYTSSLTGDASGKLLTATETTDAYGAVALEITKVDGAGTKLDISESEVKKVAAADTGAASFIVGDYDVAGYEGSDVVMDANGKIVGGSFTATESADSTAFSAALSENVQQQTGGSIVNLVNLNVISVDDNYAGLADGTVVADGIIIGVNAFASIQDAVKAAADGATIVVRGGTYGEYVTLSKEAVGSIKELNIIAAAGEKVNFTGTFQIGYRVDGTSSSPWSKHLTVDGFIFKPEIGEEKGSFVFQEVYGGLTVKNSVFSSIRDTDAYLLSCKTGQDHVVMDALFENCSFTGGRIQSASQAQDDLIFNNCTFTDVKINLQIGKGAIFNDSTFNYYFANGELTYIIRTNNDQAIEISGSTFNVDAAEDFVVEYKNGAPDFGMLWARQAGNASWVVEGCEVNYTAAALEIVSKEKDFAFIYNASTDKNKALERITVIDMTSENSAEELAAILGSSSGMVNVISDGKKTVYADGVALPMDKIVVDATKTAGEVFEVDGVSYMIGINAFTSLKDAADKAVDGTTIVVSGDLAAGNGVGFINGGTVTLTGDATFDWSGKQFYIGRSDTANAKDSTLVIKDAVIGSSSVQASTGFHVSGAEKGSANKADGTLIIENSEIEVDYFSAKNQTTLSGSTLHIKNGFGLMGRSGTESADGTDKTAVMDVNNSTLHIEKDANYGVGGYNANDAYGVLNITGSTLKVDEDLHIRAGKGTLNVNNGTVDAVKITNDGEFTAIGASKLTVGKITGSGNLTFGAAEYDADGKELSNVNTSIDLDSSDISAAFVRTTNADVKLAKDLALNINSNSGMLIADNGTFDLNNHTLDVTGMAVFENVTVKSGKVVIDSLTDRSGNVTVCFQDNWKHKQNADGTISQWDHTEDGKVTIAEDAEFIITNTAHFTIYSDALIAGSVEVQKSNNGILIGHEDAGECPDGAVVTVTGTLTGAAGINMKIQGANGAVPNSQLVIDGGMVNIGGSITNGGTIGVSDDSVLKADELFNGGSIHVSGSTIKVNGAMSSLKTVPGLSVEGESTIQIGNLDGRVYILDGAVLNNSYIKSAGNGTTRFMGSATLNGGFAAAYFQGSSAGVGGTLTIDGTVNVSYGVEFSKDYTLNGGKIILSGGNADGKVWGCVFQSGSYTIKTDIEVIGGGDTAPIHFTDATADVYSTISQSSSGGEVIYLGSSTVNLKSGGRLESEAGIHVNSGSVLNISVGGTIVANNLVINDGTVVLDASGFASGVKKVIDLKSGSSLENKITVSNLGEGVNVVYGSDGDVTLVNVDQSEVLINTGYTSQDAVDAALGENFKTYGGNAFESIASAVANTATNNPLKLLFTGSETVASTGIVYVTADTDPNVAPHSVGNFDGRDVTISGINNSAERLWVDLNDTATDDTVAASKLTFDNAKLNVSKLKASYNSVININNSELNAEYIQSSNLYGKGNGIINVTGSKLIGFNQTSALGGAVISLSDSELESGSYNRIEQGSLNVLNGSKYTFSVLSIAQGGTLNVTDSVAASKEMLSAADVANVQVFKNNPNKHVIVKVGYDWENNESAGTLNLKNAEFSIAKGKSTNSSTGAIADTTAGTVYVSESGTVNVEDSKFSADVVNNSGNFNVSGTSQLTIGTLTGAVKVTDAVLTDSVIGGGKGDVHTYGNVIVENGTFLNAEGSSRTGLTVMGGTTGLKGDVSTLVLGTDHASGTEVEKVLVISDGADVSVGLTGEDGSELKVGYLYARNDAEIIIEEGGKLNLNGQLSNRGTVTLKGKMEVAGVNGVGPIHLAGAGDPDEYGTMIIDGGELTDRKTSHQNANYLYTNTTMEIGHGGDQPSEVKVINGGKINTTNSYWNIYSDGVFKIQESSVSIVAPTNNPGVGASWIPRDHVMTNAGTIEISDASFAVDSLNNSGTITLNNSGSVTMQSLTSDHGVINLTNSTLTVEGVVALGGIDGDTIDFSAMLYQNFVISGTSMIKAETITGFLNISIDVAGIGSDVVSYKIIDTEYASDEFAYVAGYDDTSEWAIVEANGDFFMTKGDQSVLYVNSAYANDADGIVEDGKIVGYNAFGTVREALTNAVALGGGTINVSDNSGEVWHDANGLTGSYRFKFAKAGEYVITGGNGTAITPIQDNVANVTLKVVDADVQLAKIRFGTGTGDVPAEFIISNSKVGVPGIGIDGLGGGWWTFVDSKVSITNSYIGAHADKTGYNTDIRSASQVKAAENYTFLPVNQNYSSINFGTVGEAEIKDSTFISSSFNVASRGVVTVDNSVLYVGGGLWIGNRNSNHYSSWSNTSPADFRVGEAATLDIKDSIVNYIGFGSGYDAASDLLIGSSTEKAVVKLTNSELNFATENAVIAAGSEMQINNSAVKLATISNSGTITVDHASTIAFGALTNSGTITIDTTDYTSGSYKVLDYTGTGSMDYSFVSGFGTNDKLIVVDNDLYVADADNSIIYVNKDYTAENADGHLFGYNAFSTVSSALDSKTSATKQIVVNSNMTENFSNLSKLIISTENAGSTTVTSTYDSWFGLDGSTVSRNVNLVANLVFVQWANKPTVIDGSLTANGQLYVGYDAKLNINGTVKVGGSLISRYNQLPAGINVNGNGSGETQLDVDYYIGHYSESFNAKDTRIDAGYVLLDGGYDTQYSRNYGNGTVYYRYNAATMNLDNTVLNITGTVDGQKSFLVAGDAVLNLTNGSQLNGVRDFNIRATKQDSAETATGIVNIIGSTVNAENVNNNGTITLTGNAKLVTSSVITGSGAINFNETVVSNNISTDNNELYAAGNVEIAGKVTSTHGKYYQGFGVQQTSLVTVTGELTAKNYYIGNDFENSWNGSSFNSTDKLVIAAGAHLGTPAAQDTTAIYVRGTGEIEALSGALIGNTAGNIVNLMNYGKVTLTGATAYLNGFVVYGVDLEGENAGQITKAEFNASGAEINVADGTGASVYNVNGLTTTVLVGGKSGKGEGTLNLSDNTVMTVDSNFAVGYAENGTVNLSGSTLVIGGTLGIGLGEGSGQVNLDNSTLSANSITNAGTFEMDFTSTLAFVSLTNSGTFTIDLSQYNGGAFKVLDSINNNYTVEMYQALLGNAYDNRFIVVDGDLFIADFADSEIYVNNNSYSGNVGDVTADGKIIGVNAFATVDDAVAAGAQSVTVSGGEYGKTGFDGVKVTIGNATYSGAVYGGNCDENAVVSETIDLTISGGELQSAVYGGSRVHGGTSFTSGGICAVAGDVNVKVTSGSVQNVFVGGDLVTQALMFVREGDINVNISGGEFNDRVYGGITVHATANASCMAQLAGNINMTISGGDFNDRVYGGNLAGKYERGDKLTITGNISVALDVSSNSVSFAEHLVLGSSGTSAVHGNTKLTLTGLGSNLTFADNSVIVGGSGDSYYLVEGGNRTPVSFVEGTKEFAFNAFTGDLNAQIKIFDTMSFAGNSEVNFADSAINLDEISNWNFESGSLITGAANAISFNGDTINLNGSWEAGAAFELGNIDAFGDYTAWNDVTVYYGGSAVNYQFEEKENKLVITKLA